MTGPAPRHEQAVVTGAASGIGEAFALRLGASGSEVVCSDIDLAGAQRTARSIESRGGRASAVRCDVAQLEDVRALAEHCDERFAGPPSLVVNNAGVGAGGSRIGDTPLEDWRWTLGINLWGVVHGCHEFVPRLRRRQGPAGIINVASAAGFGAAPRMAAYNVSKAGVVSLSETLAAELGGCDVQVTVACPTFVRTGILTSERITESSHDLAQTLMRATGRSPDHVARACLNANLRGQLHVLPQLDARIGWHLKRAAPATFTRAMSLGERFASRRDS